MVKGNELAERMQEQADGLQNELEQLVRGDYGCRADEKVNEPQSVYATNRAGNGGGRPPRDPEDRFYSGNPEKKSKYCAGCPVEPGKWGSRAKKALYAAVVAGAFAFGTMASENVGSIVDEAMSRGSKAYSAIMGQEDAQESKEDVQNVTVEYNGGGN